MIIFDIETVPMDTDYLLANAPYFKPDSRLKDPVKIKSSQEQAKADYIRNAALNWKTAEVVMIGYGEPLMSCIDYEKQLLRDWLYYMESELVDGNSFAGHNIKGFDLPMIINRARVHRLTISPVIMSFWKGRIQWHERIFDTLEILSFGRSFEGNGVEDCARAFGLPKKLGTGADFPNLFRTNPDAAIEYNLRDVTIEIEIAKICGLK